MSKAVVYMLLATATLFLFIVRSQTNIEGKKGDLNRRFGYKILERAPIFDPIVTTIEREVEQRKQQKNNNYFDDNNVAVRRTGLGSTTSVSEVAETYQYLTSGGELNTTLRLYILFPLLDRKPKDGFIGFDELESWIIQRAMERLDYDTQVELDSMDMNGDLAVSFKEYLPHISKNEEKNNMTQGEAEWWMERFNIADYDHDGILNFTELRDFLHPEDSQNHEMLTWMVRDKLKHMDDLEIDGKLNFNEFEEHVYSTYESYMDFETNGGDVPNAKDKFAELDVNNDQFLSPEELLPIVPYLYPGEIAYAKYYTSYLMNEADDDEDERLTLQEMLNHESVFYNTVHEDGDGYEENDDEHDEL
ncbi:calumenin-A [Trifolium pratense]|uniref:calumenin-A n=1 Tax=Trifolium pratense TaxID=57577 RepID=UPI001E692155|nr:calumenin-A [Trifolium pratense]